MKIITIMILATMLMCPVILGNEIQRRPSNWAVPVSVEGVPNLYKVSDVLYRSAQPTTAGMKALQKMGVKTVINLRSFHSDKEELIGTNLGSEHIAMKTWHPEKEDVVRFLEIMTDPSRQPVLVHCQHGADRTGTMCALYRIVVEGWTKKEAVREMKEGGYGFHEIWENLPEWIDKLNVKELHNK